MLLTELIVAALAVWEIIEIYHHSSLFASARARVELLEGKIRTLLTCPFCMSTWVAWILVLPPMFAARLAPAEAEALALAGLGWLFLALWRWIIYGLALARLANLGNDLAHARCRTPRADKEIPSLREPKTTFEDSP
jgi:hypothetical protein